VTLGGVHFISRGSMDYFLVRFDADGNVISARQMGGPGYDLSVAVRAAGETMTVVGHTAGGYFKFPNGTTRSTFANDSFIYQQP
jgi:hypothetical protein